MRHKLFLATFIVVIGTLGWLCGLAWDLRS
jgi:hypothetical protein